MLLKGKKLAPPKPEVVVFPQPEGEDDLVFTCEKVLDHDEFDRLAPMPKPPMIRKPGGVEYPDENDKRYKEAVQEHGEMRVAWLLLQSTKNTEGLVWEHVRLDDPETWLSYKAELTQAGFNPYEINQLIAGVIRANNMDEERMKEARERFLEAAGQPVKAES